MPEYSDKIALLNGAISSHRIEGGHVQITQTTGNPAHNRAVYVFWNTGEVWHVPVRAHWEPYTIFPAAKKKRGRPPALSKKHSPHTTMVFLKDAQAYSCNQPIPISQAQNLRPLDEQQKNKFKAILEITRKAMRWHPLQHIEQERRMMDLGPPPGVKERRVKTRVQRKDRTD